MVDAARKAGINMLDCFMSEPNVRSFMGNAIVPAILGEAQLYPYMLYILPLNVAVGFVVCCTMYSFYMYFRRGAI